MEYPGLDSSLGLCLDFSNTIDWRNGKLGRVPKDSLTDYGELVKWSVNHGILREEEAKRLARIAKELGKDRSAMRRALDLREVIYRVFSDLVHEKKPDGRDLETLNDFISESLAKSGIVRAGEKFEWSWRGGGESPDMMLWPIAASAARLLTSEHLKDVRECANEEEGCGWVFLDLTKNHKRRWCSASGCGNRYKVRRYYAAHKEATA